MAARETENALNAFGEAGKFSKDGKIDLRRGFVLVDMERSAPADVRSLNAATLSAEVIAVVKQVNADPGQAVKKGDLLLQLEATDYQLTLQQAEANFTLDRLAPGPVTEPG